MDKIVIEIPTDTTPVEDIVRFMQEAKAASILTITTGRPIEGEGEDSGVARTYTLSFPTFIVSTA